MNKFITLSILCTFSSIALAETPLRPYVGTDNFEKLVTQGGTFVDKTLLIRDILAEQNEVILITRPRRWGKSVNMNMLRHFLKEEMNTEGKRLEPQPYRYLFENLKISHEPGVVEQFQGRYPTILITFKNIENKTFPKMAEELESAIVHLFAEYKYLNQISDWWKASDKKEVVFLNKIRENIIENKNVGFKKSLKTLSEWLYQHHGKKVYILIDEYAGEPGFSHAGGAYDKRVACTNALWDEYRLVFTA